MKKLVKIIRFRMKESDLQLIKGRNTSKYVREAVLERLERDFPDSFKTPF